MPILDFLFGEQAEYYELPWQQYGPQAYTNYQQQTNQSFYDWANRYNQQAADLYSQARGVYDQSLAHYNTSMDRIRSGLEAELVEMDTALGLLGERRDAGFAAVDYEYGQQAENIAKQSESARGSANVSRARTGMLGTTAARADQRQIDKRETEANEDLASWQAMQRRQIEGDYASGAGDIARMRQDAQRAATGMESALQAGLVSAEQQLFQSNAAIAQAYPHLMDPMPQFNFELQQAMQTTNWPGLNAMTDPGSPGLVTDMFLPGFAGMFGAGLAGGAVDSIFG